MAAWTDQRYGVCHSSPDNPGNRGRSRLFKKILVPLDGSEQSERIGGWACGLAHSLGADIVLFAVVDPDDIDTPRSEPARDRVRPMGAGQGPYDQPGVASTRGAAPGPLPSTPVTGVTPRVAGSNAAAYGTQLVDEAVERARRYLLNEAARVDVAGGKAEVEVAIGKPADEIVVAAEKLGVDAIAMATRRESALARGILGSVTDRVIHTTNLPLLVVHPESVSAFSGNAGAPSTIVVPLDGSELSEKAVPVAQEIASVVGARMLFIRSSSTPYFGGAEAEVDYVSTSYGMTEVRQDALAYLEGFVKTARDSGLEVDSRAVIASAAGAIIDAAEENEGSLIVMSTHGRSGFKRFFLGSVADKVVRSAGMPVLVLPPKND